jgi:hypothetical protein
MNRKIFTIIILAVLFFLLGATAAASGFLPIETLVPGDLDVSAFLPLLVKNYSASGGLNGTLVVFSTAASTNGSAGGRAGMNDQCLLEEPDSHFCTLSEIENAMMTGGVRFRSPFVEAWVDNPGLGTVLTHQIDGAYHDSRWQYGNCQGWATNQSAYDAVILFNDATGVNTEGQGGIYVEAHCQEVKRVACCRWAP